MGVYALVVKGVFKRMLDRMDKGSGTVTIRAKFDDGRISGYAVFEDTPDGIGSEYFGSIEEVALRLAIEGRSDQTLYLEIPESDVARLCEMRKRMFGGDVADA